MFDFNHESGFFEPRKKLYGKETALAHPHWMTGAGFFASGATGPAPVEYDPDFGYVKYLSNDGDPIDLSPAGTVVTNQGVGGVANVGPFGGSALLFDSDRLELGSTAKIAAQDFSIQLWINQTSRPGTKYLWSQYHWSSGDFANRTIFYIDPSGFLSFQKGNLAASGTTAVPLNVWNFVEVSRAGNTIYLFLNGELEATLAISGALGDFLPCFGHATGGFADGSSMFAGMMAGLRITIGKARNTTDYPVPTGPFFGASAQMTSLLMHFNGDDASAVFTDSSLVPTTFVVNGNSKLRTTQKKLGTASGLFDGAGDYLVGSGNLAKLIFGTGDFAIRFWALKSANGAVGYDTVMSTYTASNSSDGWWVELSASRGFVFCHAASVLISYNGVNFNDNLWHHYAVSRVGNQLRLFRDGVVVATVADTTNLKAAGLKIGIDHTAYNSCYNGYLDELMVLKGSGISANFTPETEEFVA